MKKQSCINGKQGWAGFRHNSENQLRQQQQNLHVLGLLYIVDSKQKRFYLYKVKAGGYVLFLFDFMRCIIKS